MARSIEDVKRLIAALLDTSGRTEDEVAEARKAAARLMVKHDLTEGDVLADNPDLLTEKTEIGRYGWIMAKYMAGTVAEVTGTKPYYTVLWNELTGKRTDRKEYCFAGYRPDVEQAVWLFRHIIEQGEQQAAGLSNDRARSDFLTTFSATVQRRLKALVKEVKEVRTDTGNALVVKKEAIIEDFLSDLNLRKGKSRGRSLRDANAAAMGRAAGEKISLSRKVGNGPLALGKK